MNFKTVVEKNYMLKPIENLTQYEVKLHVFFLTIKEFQIHREIKNSIARNHMITS